MRELGIDITISSTDSIARLLEHEIDTAQIKRLAAINQGEASICEAVLPEDYKLHGKRLSEIRLPASAIIISISRSGKTIIPARRDGASLRRYRPVSGKKRFSARSTASSAAGRLRVHQENRKQL